MKLYTTMNLQSFAKIIIYFSSTLILFITLAHSYTKAYEFPIQQYPFQQHRNLIQRQAIQQHHPLHPFSPSAQAAATINKHEPEPAQRRSSDSEETQESEVQQLRQLHQVVDTMAKLLDEEGQLNKDLQTAASRPQDMLSESDIRYALEELERVQLQERKNNPNLIPSEARLRPTIVNPFPFEQMPSPAALTSNANSNVNTNATKESTLESLIDELGEEMMLNDQQQQQHHDEVSRANPAVLSNSNQNNKQQISTPNSLQVSSTLAPETKAQESSVSPLFTGQLDPLSSSSSSSSSSNNGDLGSALTNDFYTFHVDTISSSNIQDDKKASIDLDQAAQQTRTSILQQEGNSFNEAPVGFSQQPQNFNNQPQNQQPQSNTQQMNPQQTVPKFVGSQQENLVRVFRQQSNNNNEQPTGTFNEQQFNPLQPDRSPLSGLPRVQDTFWRPSGQNQNTFNNDDLSQQFNRASNLALPAPRFQSLAPASPFNINLNGPNNKLTNNKPTHSHFTGHSIISSPDIPSPNQQNLNSQPRQQTSSSTGAPMISVLSGGDSLVGSSVNWNPPAALGFNPQFPSTQLSSTRPPIENNLQFFQPPQQGPPPPPPPPPQLPNRVNPFQQDNNNNLIPPPPQPNVDGLRQNNNFQGISSTEANFIRPETTTTNQWSQPAIITSLTQGFNPTTTSSNLLSETTSEERETSDSRPRSSFRQGPNRENQENERFFSPSDLSSPTPNPPLRNTQATPNPPPATTTLANPTNTTNKKEDMVIYYYYYYDDNKNATVVAKNVSSTVGGSSTSAPVSLDAAIEADGGVEDTPYMDDPVQPARPGLSSTTSSTTSTSSTTLGTRFEPSSTLASVNFREGNENFNFSPKPAIPRQPFSTFTSPKNSEATTVSSWPIRQPAQQDLRSSISDNAEPSFPGRAPQIPRNQQQQPPQQARLPANFNTTPRNFIPPTTTTTTTTTTSTTHRTRLAQQEFPKNQSDNRFIASNNLQTSTESHAPHHNSFTAPPPSAGTESRQQHSPSSGGNRQIQTDLINDILSGVVPVANQRQPTQASNNNNRVPSTHLSNASRYGTSNNNLFVDPFAGPGLEPVSRSPPLPAGNTPQDHHQGQHSRNSAQSNQQLIRNQPIHNDHLRSNQANQPTRPLGQSQIQNGNTNGEQHFSSQRNSNNNNNVTPISPSGRQQASRVPVQPAPVQPNRQFFPEQANHGNNNHEATRTHSNIDQQVKPRDQALNSLRQPSIAPASVTSSQFVQPQAEGSQISNSGRFNNGDSSDENNQAPANLNRIQPSNGRPSSQEGNTSNGFTRTPLNVQSNPVTPAPTGPVSSVSNINNNFSQERRIPPQTTTISTSVSRSFVTPQQVQPVTSSVSSPSTTTQTISSSSIAPSTTIISQAPAITTTTTSVVTSSSQSATVSPTLDTSTSAPTDDSSSSSSSSSAAAASSLASSRNKKFGNRNNRFQTRLNSAKLTGSTSSTTTSTTVAPSVSSSTTRRPMASTTRKTSKQLFVGGRRRLGGSTSSTVSNGNPNNGLDQQSSNSSSPVIVSTSTAFSVTESSSSLVVNSNSQPAGRSRFGNSFTARTRTASSTPSPPEISSTQRPSNLFGQQNRPNATFRPKNSARLTKPAAGSGESSAPASQPAPPPQEQTPASENKPSTGSLTPADETAAPVSEATQPATSMPSEMEETGAMEMKKEASSEADQSPLTTNTTTTTSTTTTTPSPNSADSAARNKPKVRPLFASRQRSSSLFGNRRNNNGTTTAS